MATSWLVLIAMGIALGIVYLAALVNDLLRTLRRIEARMSLLNPLEEEQKVLKGTGHLDFSTRGDIRDRAIQPDIWWRLYRNEIKDLKGEELKEEKGIWRSRERSRRRLSDGTCR